MARILIVDDQKNARVALEITLRRAGHAVEEAETAEEALARLARGGFDLLVTDLRLRETDGLSLLRDAKGRWPELPVIIMTAFGSIDNAVHAMQTGAGDYITKPFEAGQIVLAVTRALEHGALAREVQQLREVVRRRTGLDRIIGCSPVIRRVREVILQVARTDSPALLAGESGTGKELAARAIHELSDRATGAFVAINCGALPETLQESELFGYAPGAFTGARNGKRGLIEEANGGVLFLDEIIDLDPSAQVKLLRVLQDGDYRRLGETTVRHVDARIIAATNRDLREAVRTGRFREDLFYRIHVVPVMIPPLRQRLSDVPLLAEHVLQQYRARLGRPELRLTRPALEQLSRYDWPGNVRELESAIARAVTLLSGDQILVTDLPEHIARTNVRSLDPASLADSERSVIRRTLDQHGWHRDDAARALGISRTTLWRKVRRYRIDFPRPPGVN